MEGDDDFFYDYIFHQLIKTLNSIPKEKRNYIAEKHKFYASPKYQSPEWLIEQFEKGLSTKQVAKEAGCHIKTLKKYLKKFDLTEENYNIKKNELFPKVPFKKQKKKKPKYSKQTIETIKNLHKEGWSLRQICKVLDSVPSMSLKGQKNWHPEMIRRILESIK